MCETVKLDFSSKEIQHLMRVDKRLAKVILQLGPLEYPIYKDPYRFLVGQIINQMLSNQAAHCISNRLEDLCGGSISVERVSALSDEDIRNTGTAWSKVEYIRNLTEAVVNKSIVFSELENLSDDEVIDRITSIRGLGIWSAKMYLLFALNRPDVLPYEDVAFKQSFRWLYKTDVVTPDVIKKKCAKWKPYSSIASRYLYDALDTGLTKSEFHLFRS